MWHSPNWLDGSVVVLLSAALALGIDYVHSRVDRHGGHFLGVGSSVANVAWRLAMLLLIVVALDLEHHAPLATIGSMWRRTERPSTSSAAAIVLLVALYGAAALWSRIPFVGKWAASSPQSYKPGGELSVGAFVVLVLVRYPLTVFAEETLFRGYLMRTLGWGALIASVAFAAYHVTQWKTIPSLLPYTIAGGVIVLWTGALWPAALVHYFLDSGFALLILRAGRRRTAASSRTTAGT